MHRSQAEDFLSLLNQLSVTDEELRMADNYFSILSNTPAEVWFDQGIELGGGQPFTVGTEGESRNRRHIVSSRINVPMLVIDQLAGPSHTLS